MEHRAKRARALLTTERIQPAEVIASVADSGAGATVLFLGTVRDFGDSGRVKELTYEAYAPLARRGLSRIGQEMLRRWKVKRVELVHRFGRMKLGEISVAIAVSSPHRQDAFEAGRFAIEQIKKTIPIWKKEMLSNGLEVWTEGSRIVDGKRIAVQ